MIEVNENKLLILNLHANSRRGALFLFAICMVGLGVIQITGWLTFSELMEFSTIFDKWPKRIALATVLFLVFFLILVLFNALGSNLAIFDTEKRLFHWKRHLLWIPFPGVQVPFDQLEHIYQREGSKMSQGRINDVLRVQIHHYKEVVLDIQGRPEPLVLFTIPKGKNLPEGCSATSIGKRLGWKRSGKGWAPKSKEL